MAVDAVSTTGSLILNPLIEVWNGFVTILPGIIAAIILIIIGYFVALGIGHLVRMLLEKAGLDKYLEKSKFSKAVGHFNLSKILGEITKWYIFLIFLVAATDERVLHLGAVWVNNFPNHLYYLSESLLKKHHLPFELFGPLILSTAENGIKNPKASQTGPAKRNDKKTMKEHLKLLPDKNYRDLYKMLSKSIINLYN